jgi:hypothetical protein
MGYTFLSSQTADDDPSIDFTSGIDGTYDEYLFTIVNYKPVTDSKQICFQVDTGTNTSYNQTITSTSFYAGTSDTGGWAQVVYAGGHDQAEGDTALQILTYGGESNTIPSLTNSGELRLYAPSSSAYIKHFTASVNCIYDSSGTRYNITTHTAGYVNTTTALTRVRFAASSDNIYTGTFTLYGVS